MTAPGSNQGSAHQKELELLLASLVEVGLSADQKTRLCQLLKDDTDVQRFYKRYLEVHAMLEWEAGTVATQGSASDDLKDLLRMEREAQAELVHDIGQLRRRPSSPWQIKAAWGWAIQHPAAWAATAAVLALALILFVVFQNGPDAKPLALNPSAPSAPATPFGAESDPAPVATLTNQHNAQWGTPSAERALARGSSLHPGTRLTLTAGFAEITTQRGAVAILEAPCTIELTDNGNALHLHAGKLVGLCHTESSKGFLVRTDHADIIDLGTEFGVHAHSAGVDTTVFVGEVAVKTPNAPSQVITDSQTVRISTDNDQPTLVVEDKPTAGFARRLPRAPLITDASINLEGFAIEVVPDGVYEDAKLYADRDHELNGIDVSGIPAFLIGGDLVRMPASARPDVQSRVSDSLQLTLELSALCDIYVLLPEEGKAGDWLERDYANTGLFVGNDLAGRTEIGETTYESGVGPGSSIDRSVAIWKRKQPASGKTTIAENITDSMYSVIVLPHQPFTQPLRP